MPNASRFAGALALLVTVGLQDTAADAARRVNAERGHVYLISESHPVGASLSDFRIRLEAPGSLPREVSLRDRDPLREAFAGDLDGNGVPVIVTGGFHAFPPYENMSNITLWRKK